MQRSNQIPTQDHFQDLLLISILEHLYPQHPGDIIPTIHQEITKKCPEIHLGDQILCIINPDDLTLDFPSEQESKEFEQNKDAWELFSAYTVYETENDEVTFYIAAY